METAGAERKNAVEEADIRQAFDQVLAKHIDPIAADLKTVLQDGSSVCGTTLLVLLKEREQEREQFGAQAVEPLTPENLIAEAIDMGIADNGALRRSLQALQTAGAVVPDKDGCLNAGPPAHAFLRQLDGLLPGMPGLNLVAYAAQTIDEVRSNRKSLSAARDQFDQTLGIQRRGGRKDSGQAGGEPEPSAEAGAPPAKRPLIDRSTIRKRLRAAVQRRGGQNVIGASTVASRAPETIRPLAFGAPPPPGPPAAEEKVDPSSALLEKDFPAADAADNTGPDFAAAGAAMDRFSTSESSEDAAPPKADDTPAADDSPAADDTPAAPAKDPPEEPDGMPLKTPTAEAITPEAAAADPAPQTAPSPVADASADDVQPPLIVHTPAAGAPSMDDTAVEERIAAFEDDLSLRCPVCGKAKVAVKTTPAGREYYQCTAADCAFISWGKPVHRRCPWCDNPFMIERMNRNHEIMIQCPRATCRYKESAAAAEPSAGAPPPEQKKKRRVRRVRVRRKR